MSLSELLDIKRSQARQSRLRFSDVANERHGALGQTKSQRCVICHLRMASYTCPTCNIPYCSLECFRSPQHSSCSSNFVDQTLRAELEARAERDEQTQGSESETKASDEERRAMMRLLRKFRGGDTRIEVPEGARPPEGFDGEDEDDDDAEGSRDRGETASSDGEAPQIDLAALNLEDASEATLLGLLTHSERQRFLDAVSEGGARLEALTDSLEWDERQRRAAHQEAEPANESSGDRPPGALVGQADDEAESKSAPKVLLATSRVPRLVESSIPWWREAGTSPSLPRIPPRALRDLVSPLAALLRQQVARKGGELHPGSGVAAAPTPGPNLAFNVVAVLIVYAFLLQHLDVSHLSSLLPRSEQVSQDIASEQGGHAVEAVSEASGRSPSKQSDQQGRHPALEAATMGQDGGSVDEPKRHLHADEFADMPPLEDDVDEQESATPQVLETAGKVQVQDSQSESAGSPVRSQGKAQTGAAAAGRAATPAGPETKPPPHSPPPSSASGSEDRAELERQYLATVANEELQTLLPFLFAVPTPATRPSPSRTKVPRAAQPPISKSSSVSRGKRPRAEGDGAEISRTVLASAEEAGLWVLSRIQGSKLGNKPALALQHLLQDVETICSPSLITSTVGVPAGKSSESTATSTQNGHLDGAIDVEGENGDDAKLGVSLDEMLAALPLEAAEVARPRVRVLGALADLFHFLRLPKWTEPPTQPPSSAEQSQPKAAREAARRKLVYYAAFWCRLPVRVDPDVAERGRRPSASGETSALLPPASSSPARGSLPSVRDVLADVGTARRLLEAEVENEERLEDARLVMADLDDAPARKLLASGRRRRRAE